MDALFANLETAEGERVTGGVDVTKIQVVHLVVDVDVELSFDVYAVKLTADFVNAVGGVPVDVVHKRVLPLFVFFSVRVVVRVVVHVVVAAIFVHATCGIRNQKIFRYTCLLRVYCASSSKSIRRPQLLFQRQVAFWHSCLSMAANLGNQHAIKARLLFDIPLAKERLQL